MLKRLAVFVFLGFAAGLVPQSFVSANGKSVNDRVEDLLGRMTLDEKVAMVHGHGFKTVEIKRLGIPRIVMADGAVGVRVGRSTAFAAGEILGSSFDRELAQRIGQAIAVETKGHGRNMLLGPNLNILRTPFGGRNFEMYSEDPYLNSILGASYIQAMQKEGVIATPKHFMMNDEEADRMSVDVRADERTMHEIYLPPFQAAVDAGAGSIMAAYNKVNGRYCTENDVLVNSILKGELGFQNFVISDWGATHSTVDAANAGLDLEMPNSAYFSSALLQAVKNGQVSEKVLDDKVRRILRAMFSAGLFDNPAPTPGSAVHSPAHVALALKEAEEGIVLLKNDRGVLPLTAKERRIAVIGPNAMDTPIGGGGSAHVSPPTSVSMLEGMKTVFGRRIHYDNGDDISQAAQVAREAEVAFVFVGFAEGAESEGFDRANMSLPGGQDDLISAVAKANSNTIVVINSGSPVMMPWLPQVRGLIQAWYAGEESGLALAHIVSGAVNPSGKLPMSFPKRWEDAAAYGAYPPHGGVMEYKEGLYVGYRHFDARNIEPQFAFGFGLSYTTFTLSPMDNKPILSGVGEPQATISVALTNTGALSGADVVQLYVAPVAPQVDRPVQELKGFERVELAPHETRRVEFHLDAHAFRYWNAQRHGWQVDPGKYEIRVGDSSRGISVTQTVELN